MIPNIIMYNVVIYLNLWLVSMTHGWMTVMSLNSIKHSYCFLELETLTSLLSTGLFNDSNVIYISRTPTKIYSN